MKTKLKMAMLCAAAAIAILGASEASASGLNVWSQVGSDIDGEAGLDRTGFEVSLSADGQTVAVGGFAGNFGDDDQLRVFRNENGTWSQVGNTIGSTGISSHSFELSSDGRRLAAFVRDSTTWVPSVRVFENAGDSWTQVGNDIGAGGVGDDLGGLTWTFSGDGKTVAVYEARYKDDDEVARVLIDLVRVFTEVGGEWVQVGDDLDRIDGLDVGSSLSLSEDGSRLAVNAWEPWLVERDFDEYRLIQVMVLEVSGGSWSRVGATIDVDRPETAFAQTELSADGKTLALQMRTWDRYSVRLFEDGSDRWVQAGDDLEPASWFSDMAMSADGRTVALGTSRHGGSAPGIGKVQIFNRAGDRWEPIGRHLTGDEQNDQAGSSVALSADGTTLAFGAPNNYQADMGFVRVLSRPATFCSGIQATIVGSSKDDVIRGTSGVDVIAGLQGDDIIRGLSGDDVICGGQGDDVIYGGQGFDVIFGAQGNDTIYFSDGQALAERIDTAGGRAFGGVGDDDIYGSIRWDRMQGGAGTDRLFGFEGRDWIRGGPGTDVVNGGTNIDNLHGGLGRDQLVATNGDVAHGGAGKDTCFVLSSRNIAKSRATLLSCKRPEWNR